jgi:hypothetical protein
MRCLGPVLLVPVIAGALVGCAGDVPDAAPVTVAPSPAAGVAPDAVPPPVSWPSGADCAERLAAALSLPEAARQRLDLDRAPLAVLVTGSGRQAMTLDLPAPVVVAEAAATAPCLVVIERSTTAPAAARRPVGHEIARATYRRGTQRTASPEHTALKQALRELEREDGIGVMATGDPGIDLIGLVAGSILGGIDALGRGRDAEELEAELATTPRTLEEPVWEPYTYEVTTVETARRGRLRAALVDREQGRSWQVATELRETASFRVASGRHPKDRDLLERQGGGVVLPADVTVWERGGLQPPLSRVLAMLLAEANAGPGHAEDAAAILAGWAAQAVPAEEAAVVAPEAGPARDGSGRASLVEQEVAADGSRRYRVVPPATVTDDP